MDGLIAYALSKKYADEVGRSILDAGFKTQVEQDRSILQTTGQEKILYFIPKTTAKPSDGYDEYVYSNNAWEQVGATDVNMSSIDYTQISNIPYIMCNDPVSDPYNSYRYKFTGTFGLNQSADSGLRIIKDGSNFYISIDPTKVITVVKNPYQFDINIKRPAPMLVCAKSNGYSNLPSFVSAKTDTEIFFIQYSKKPSDYRTQQLYWIDSNDKVHHAIRICSANAVSAQDGWQEIGGGSGIQSATTNSNGTMQFAMSDGSIVTSGGSNIVTSGSEQISMGYDSGGFYFLFDDGQEVVNNGTN